MKMGIKNVVKNITNGLFPPKCRGCGEIGDYLCVRCKKYISDNMHDEYIVQQDVFREAIYLGNRDEILGELIEECKYESVRGLTVEIADVVWEGYLRERCEKFDSPLILVPMPTNRKHVRERGFDHMDKIAREIELLSCGKIKKKRLLERNKDTVQVGAKESVRKKQAQEAVRVNRRFLDEKAMILDEYRNKEIMLMDDVWTTGASLMEAGKLLKGVGVRSLSALAITKNRSSVKRGPVIRHGDL